MAEAVGVVAILLFWAWVLDPDKFVEALKVIRGGKK